MKPLGSARLIVDGQELELPVYVGTEKEKTIDIDDLREKTGCITLDHGYLNTGSCLSTITYIDGDKGILRYRGYPIEELAKHSNFIETSFLLIRGHLPSPDELHEFISEIKHSTPLDKKIQQFYDGVPQGGHPMAVLASMVSAMSTFYQEYADPQDSRHIHLAIYRLMGKIPSILAYGFKKTMGQAIVEPDPSLDYSSNFLHMMFANPAGNYKVDPVLAKALDTALLLHADHEQSCSTSTVRLVGTSGANMYASISAGISALWGYFHGGAAQAVVEMLQEIHNSGISAKDYIEKVKRKEDGIRLMGFGHRVYKNFDPRAKIIKKLCHDVLKRTGHKSPLFELAQKLENIALKDDYFLARKLYPNVDYYTGITYLALGIPVNMYTVMFAMGRMPGWIAQWLEMKHDPATKLGRPRQVYTGSTIRHYPANKKR